MLRVPHHTVELSHLVYEADTKDFEATMEFG